MQSSVASIRYEEKYLSMVINEKGQRLIFLLYLYAIYWGETGISLLKKIEMRPLQFPLLCCLSQTLHFRAVPQGRGEGIYAARFTQERE